MFRLPSCTTPVYQCIKGPVAPGRVHHKTKSVIMIMRPITNFFTLFTLAILAAPAMGWAQPAHWEMGLQEAATPVAERLHDFNDFLTIIISIITVFVTGLLIFVMIRFNAKAHPVPSTRTHNFILEIIWTVIPVVILIAIAVPSFKLLYYMDRTENPDMTLKVTGFQWYWGY